MSKCCLFQFILKKFNGLYGTLSDFTADRHHRPSVVPNPLLKGGSTLPLLWWSTALTPRVHRQNAQLATAEHSATLSILTASFSMILQIRGTGFRSCAPHPPLCNIVAFKGIVSRKFYMLFCRWMDKYFLRLFYFIHFFYKYYRYRFV
jgi:hypothetical protein